MDERANVVYTDQWRPGARRVEPEPGGVVPAPDAVKRRVEAPGPAAALAITFDRVETTAPGPDETVQDDGEGHPGFAVSVSPAMPGHRMRALRDEYRSKFAKEHTHLSTR